MRQPHRLFPSPKRQRQSCPCNCSISPGGPDMKFRFAVPFLLLLLFAATGSSYASVKTEALGRKAVSENSLEAGPAITELRSMGPVGLNSLFELYRSDIDRHIANP